MPVGDGGGRVGIGGRGGACAWLLACCRKGASTTIKCFSWKYSDCVGFCKGNATLILSALQRVPGRTSEIVVPTYKTKLKLDKEVGGGGFI